ncbi:hypothetical protein Tco_0255577 [Tanacetum coccineum]
MRECGIASVANLMSDESNVLLLEALERFDESDTHVLERFNTSAGNLVKEILLKLNLPDHRILKDGGEVKEFQRSFRHSDTERLSRSDEVLKLKNFKKDATLKLFKSTNQERYEHVGPEVTSSQDGKVYKMAKRDYAWLMISRCSRSHSRQGSRDDSDKDQDPSLDQTRDERRKSCKEVSIRDSRSREKKSSSTSKDASQSQRKHSGKSAHAEEPSHIVDDSGVQQDQDFVTGDIDEQLTNKEVSKADCEVAHVEEPRTSFDELMDTSFDFSTFILNRLKIKDPTQEILVGLSFELLKGTCKNKPLLLIPYHRGRQVIPQDFFINNDLEYLKGGDLSRRYSTSGMKTKATTYEIKWIKDLVHNLWSPVKEKNHCGLQTYDMKTYDPTILGKEIKFKVISMTAPKDIEGIRMFKMELSFKDGGWHARIDVQTVLYDIAKGIRMEYLPKRKWSRLDKRRARVMVQDIDKQLYERRLMQNLEKFVGGREYGNDLRLLERTI